MTGRAVPIALSIAGSDPSGGAGIQADLKTFSVLGVYGANVITALTAQNTLGVTGVHQVPADFIRAQFAAVTQDLRVNAIKTGMLGNVETVVTVADLLEDLKPPHLVVDPVMVATSGDRLLDENAIYAVGTKLIPLAALITPNLPEAAALLDCPVAATAKEAEAQAKALLKFGCRAVLLKGGHGEGDDAADHLVMAGKTVLLTGPRIVTRNTHGTGCTLAAAITAGLAKGFDLETAAALAKAFVRDALQSGAGMIVGQGNGPVDHLFDVRKCSEWPRS